MKTATTKINEEKIYFRMEAAKDLLFNNVNRMRKRWTYRTDIDELRNCMRWGKYGKLIELLKQQHKSKTRDETILVVYTIMHCCDRLGLNYEA